MKSHLLHTAAEAEARRPAAVVIFAGWGMDWRPLEALYFARRDTLVVYDYASAADPEGRELARELAERYADICVVGWSFGVYWATRWLLGAGKDVAAVTLRIAVNGTVAPVDEQRGIAPKIFLSTLEHLSDESLAKFRLRMCGSRQAYASFMESAPERSLASLRAELKQMAEAPALDRDSSKLWDFAFVGLADRIFPPQAQLQAWPAPTKVITIDDGAHMPSWTDMQQRISALLVDKDVVAGRFRRASRTYDDNALVQRQMAHHLAKMLPAKLHGSLLEVGVGTGLLTRLLRERMAPDATLRLWDLAPIAPDVEQADAEAAIRELPSDSLDLIASSSAVQWFHSPGAFLRECHRVIRPGGILAIAAFGSETYRELSELIGNLAYRTADEWIELARGAGWGEAQVSSSVEVMTFPDAVEVLRHMKLTGVNALCIGGSTVRAARQLVNAYPRDPESGLCPLTYNPVYLLARKVES